MGPTAIWSTPSPKPSLAMFPMYLIRAFGGLLYLAGAHDHDGQRLDDNAGKQRDEAPMTETPYDPEAGPPDLAVAVIPAE
jgi:cytochrome c oxidase cbb3-type subunit 1